MSCDCSVIPNSANGEVKPLETPLQNSTSTSLNSDSDTNKPTEMLPGENIDCYARRASTNGKNDVAEKIENKIDNTSLVCDLNGFVNEQFRLTPGSSRTATEWKIKIDGEDQIDESTLSIPNLQFINARLTGTLSDAVVGKTFRVLIIAKDEDGEIDSKEYTLVAKKTTETTGVLKFVFPYESNGRVTCSYGPRNPPVPGASSMHKGIDISQPGPNLGYILAASDGIAVKCGPARGYGNWVVIEHRDSSNAVIATTVYGHMNDIYVDVGQRVSAGQRIAKEGNAGLGSAAHLHFELHRGKLGNPVDPIPYINGQITIAQNNLKGQFGIPDESSFQTISNSSRGMTADEKPIECSSALDYSQPINPEPLAISSSSSDNLTARQIVERVIDEDSELSAEDKKILLFIAEIESGFKPAEKNPTSSARGIFQMLDRTANVYFRKIGEDASVANRNDPEISTKAQIRFYKDEMLRYWDEFNSSKVPGPATIAGIKLTEELTAKYSSLTKGEFIYGLIHHDGVKNAALGKDLQGVDYWRRRIRTA